MKAVLCGRIPRFDCCGLQSPCADSLRCAVSSHSCDKRKPPEAAAFVILIRSALPLRKAEDVDSASRFDIALDFRSRSVLRFLLPLAVARLDVGLGFHGLSPLSVFANR
jgi:hypothetical protein